MADKTNDIDDKYILQSVANAFDILDLLTEYEELTINEICDHMGLSRSSVFRLLATMESRRFVRKTETNRYRLGIKLTAMGNLVYSRMEIIQYAHPFLQELSREASETANFSIWDDDTHIRFADRVLNTQSMNTNTWIGSVMPAHLTGGGKALLAFSPERRAHYAEKASFERVTEKSIRDAKQLEEVLNRITEQGYAVDDEEAEEGLYCIAAPVTDGNGQAAAAVSLTGPVGRLMKNREKNIEMVKKCAASISEAISMGAPRQALPH